MPNKPKKKYKSEKLNQNVMQTCHSKKSVNVHLLLM